MGTRLKTATWKNADVFRHFVEQIGWESIAEVAKLVLFQGMTWRSLDEAGSRSFFFFEIWVWYNRVCGLGLIGELLKLLMLKFFWPFNSSTCFFDHYEIPPKQHAISAFWVVGILFRKRPIGRRYASCFILMKWCPKALDLWLIATERITRITKLIRSCGHQISKGETNGSIAIVGKLQVRCWRIAKM